MPAGEREELPRRDVQEDEPCRRQVAEPAGLDPHPALHVGALQAQRGGAIGDPLNGVVFDLLGGYRPLFLVMALYASLALVAVMLIPRGIGEADTGPGAPISEPARPRRPTSR